MALVYDVVVNGVGGLGFKKNHAHGQDYGQPRSEFQNSCEEYTNWPSRTPWLLLDDKEC
jgi:hypothetical protein